MGENKSRYIVEMLEGFSGAINEKHLAWYLVNSKYLIKMLMVTANEINLR